MITIIIDTMFIHYSVTTTAVIITIVEKIMRMILKIIMISSLGPSDMTQSMRKLYYYYIRYRVIRVRMLPKIII